MGSVVAQRMWSVPGPKEALALSTRELAVGFKSKTTERPLKSKTKQDAENHIDEGHDMVDGD